tara:strand:- start:119 stop:463 length:345 start_codon:yes stop_codon:yes gene_type:complete
MGQHRPLNDRIAETQAQLMALKAKMLKDQINESSEIIAIDDEIREITNSMLKYNRWASEGEEKIANFNARAIEWESRLLLASQKRKEANITLTSLREQRKEKAESMASDMEANG